MTQVYGIAKIVLDGVFVCMTDDQPQLLLPRPALNFRLPLERLAFGFELFGISQRHRSPSLGVVRTRFGVVVRMHSVIEVVGHSDIECGVRAFEDVNDVDHVVEASIRYLCMKIGRRADAPT